jgi:predicted HTH transcriptional regulator
VEKPLPAYQICRGTLFEMIDQATAFVMDRVDLAVGTRSEGNTASVPTDFELPPDAVKEAIVNICLCKPLHNSNYVKSDIMSSIRLAS